MPTLLRSPKLAEIRAAANRAASTASAAATTHRGATPSAVSVTSAAAQAAVTTSVRAASPASAVSVASSVASAQVPTAAASTPAPVLKSILKKTSSKRAVIKDFWYELEHMENLGQKWMDDAAPGRRLFVAPQGESSSQAVNRTGLTQAEIEKITPPCKVLLPINQSGKHWVAITANVTMGTNGKKSVKLSFTDSLNSTAKFTPAIKAEMDRIQGLFGKDVTVTREIYPHTWKQKEDASSTRKDYSSCGPYSFANAVRCLDGKGEEPNPGGEALRQQQLDMMTDEAAIRSCSINKKTEVFIRDWVAHRRSIRQSPVIDSNQKFIEMCEYLATSKNQPVQNVMIELIEEYQNPLRIEGLMPATNSNQFEYLRSQAGRTLKTNDTYKFIGEFMLDLSRGDKKQAETKASQLLDPLLEDIESATPGAAKGNSVEKARLYYANESYLRMHRNLEEVYKLPVETFAAEAEAYLRIYRAKEEIERGQAPIAAGSVARSDTATFVAAPRTTTTDKEVPTSVNVDEVIRDWVIDRSLNGKDCAIDSDEKFTEMCSYFANNQNQDIAHVMTAFTDRDNDVLNYVNKRMKELIANDEILKEVVVQTTEDHKRKFEELREQVRVKLKSHEKSYGVVASIMEDLVNMRIDDKALARIAKRISKLPPDLADCCTEFVKTFQKCCDTAPSENERCRQYTEPLHKDYEAYFAIYNRIRTEEDYMQKFEELRKEVSVKLGSKYSYGFIGKIMEDLSKIGTDEEALTRITEEISKLPTGLADRCLEVVATVRKDYAAAGSKEEYTKKLFKQSEAYKLTEQSEIHRDTLRTGVLVEHLKDLIKKGRVDPEELKKLGISDGREITTKQAVDFWHARKSDDKLFSRVAKVYAEALLDDPKLRHLPPKPTKGSIGRG